MHKFDWPLMNENIEKSDLEGLISFLRTGPRLTQGAEVRKFEAAWSEWLGVKHSVFVNSGSSANFVTMHALRHTQGEGEVILPPLTWVSDVCSVLSAGLRPVFADISWKTLALDPAEVAKKITRHTRAVFLTHILGLNGLSDDLFALCREKNIALIEDTCESHGARFGERKLGTFGLASNFSFYFGHHLSTVEGGMVCTDDPAFYDCARSLRGHGLVREMEDPAERARWAGEHPGLHPEFIFAYPGFNFRGTEMQAHLGTSQLKSLDLKNQARVRNNEIFLSRLNPEKYYLDFDYRGSVNYAFILVVHPRRRDQAEARQKVTRCLEEMGVEFRRGLSGGGNQLRQPYLKRIVGNDYHREFPVVEYIHENSYYLGNYPGLAEEKINRLCDRLNRI